MAGSDDIKRLVDIVKESRLALTILGYARSGNATPIMIEQAILLVDKQITYANECSDSGMLKSALSLKQNLRQALIDGIQSMRVVSGPGREKLEVEEPLALSLRKKGHSVRSQVKCSFGIVDIYDLTTDELIECKYLGTSAALGEAAGQLDRYRKAFPGSGLVIAVLRIEVEAQWLAGVLRERGIAIIEIETLAHD